MTPGAQKLLEEFDALPEPERSELVAELARRVALSPHDLPRDDDLVAAADLRDVLRLYISGAGEKSESEDF